MSFALADHPGLCPLPLSVPGLTPEALVQRAVAPRPVLREQQTENEVRGTYGEDLRHTFRDAGFYRITQPGFVLESRPLRYGAARTRGRGAACETFSLGPAGCASLRRGMIRGGVR